MNNDERYRSASQQRILKMLLLLGGHEVEGLAPSQIGQSLQIAASVVTHDLANLRLAGVAEQIPETGRWRLSPRVPQIAVAMLNSLDQRTGRLADIRQRYTRDPK